MNISDEVFWGPADSQGWGLLPSYLLIGGEGGARHLPPGPLACRCPGPT